MRRIASFADPCKKVGGFPPIRSETAFKGMTCVNVPLRLPLLSVSLVSSDVLMGCADFIAAQWIRCDFPCDPGHIRKLWEVIIASGALAICGLVRWVDYSELFSVVIQFLILLRTVLSTLPSSVLKCFAHFEAFLRLRRHCSSIPCRF